MAGATTTKVTQRRRASKADAAPTTPDPIEIAMDAEKADRRPDSPARTLLRNQNRLVLWEIRDRRAAFGLKLLAALGGLLVLIGAGLLVADARSARGVVIEAFSVPPDMAQRGLTGEVAASQLMDELAALQTATGGSRAPTSYTNDWGGDIRVQIPQTGVDLGDLQRALRLWLGRQTRVGGDIVRVPGGVRVTVRANGAASSVTGPEAQIDGLIRAGALEVYRQTQPFRYASYLTIVPGRLAEARSEFAAVAATGPPEDRPWAYAALGNMAPSTAEQIAHYKRATELGPNVALGWSNLTTGYGNLGHTEAAHAAAERAVEALARRDFGGYRPERAAMTLGLLKARLASDVGDYSAAIAAHDPETWLAAAEDDRISIAYYRASAYVGRHEPAAARRILLPSGASDAEIMRLPMWRARGTRHSLPSAAIREELGDWAGALAEIEAFEALLLEIADSGTGLGPRRLRDMIQVSAWPRRAEVLARLGRLDEAAELIGQTSTTCEPCLRVRGLVAHLRGDTTGADRWYAEAARQAPSLPFAATEWGEAKLARGDTAGAIALARQAQRVGPRFADPLKLEGDARLKAGDARKALDRYAAAATFAPRWGALHLMWGEALAAQGKADEARAKWRAAAGMDLTPAERARVTALLAGAKAA